MYYFPVDLIAFSVPIQVACIRLEINFNTELQVPCMDSYKASCGYETVDNKEPLI